jgi:hypothetical protein
MEKPQIPPGPDLPPGPERYPIIASFCAQLRGMEAFRWFCDHFRQEQEKAGELALSKQIEQKERDEARERYHALDEVLNFVTNSEVQAKEKIAAQDHARRQPQSRAF